ncbi:mltA-interacting protein, partial [Yersinia pestis PY-32]
MHANRQ